MSQTKTYNSAPLPFMGQKRRFLKRVKDIVVTHPEDVTYVDLFGGSGLLSHTIKKHRPNARVIYNDFDNYRQRLETIHKTNAILKDVREITQGLPKDKKMPEIARKAILERVWRAEQEDGFVDYITLSSSLLFSMKYVTSFAELSKETFYNVVKQSDYDATGYLEGVEVVSGDYKEIYTAFKPCSNVIWLIDPPYLSTETKTYSSDSYWKLKDYLDVLNVLEGANYVYFTSNKSQILELCEWIENRVFTANPFNGANISTTEVQMNYNASYTDVMLYKFTGSSTM